MLQLEPRVAEKELEQWQVCPSPVAWEHKAIWCIDVDSQAPLTKISENTRVWAHPIVEHPHEQ